MPVLSLSAQTAIERLDPYVILATRTPVDPATLGTVVDVISGADLNREQISSLAGALGGTAAPLFASGQPGATTSLFLRGANSNQTLFLVDGIRFSDPNTDYGPFLGGACASACDELEVAHGPQSTLYGGEAVGGVVSLRALPGQGEPTARVAVEAGSFGTVQGAVAAQGETNGWGYNFSAQGGHTDNRRVNNDFDSTNATLRLDRKLTNVVAMGGTLRWFHGVYGSPGDRFTNDPDNQEREDNLLGTIFTQLKPSPQWDARVTLGGQDRRYVSNNPRPGGPTQITVVKNRRGVLDAQTTYHGFERNRVTVGGNAEENSTRNTGFGDINKKQTLLAVFAEDEYTPIDNVYLTAGLRRDDFDTFGAATTGRVTAAWLIVPKTVKLRATYGTAFRSPSFLDLYGKNTFYVGNPNLRPEHARSWDAGVDYYLPEKRGSIGVTWFESHVHDLIVNDFSVFPSTTANVDRARMRGLELSAQANLPGAIDLRVAYNYLEAVNQSQGIRLLRRPRHNVSAAVWHDFGNGFSAGTGLRIVADRQDINARTFATIEAEDYTVARVYAAWKANERWTVKARIENALNEKYEEVNGYPQLGFGAFAGVEYRF